ncbi:hypothetical protein [Xanthobacter flavus]|uniref:hypothetical protein n=1 Tax=Xanthobacter flavus TaxID=281 RepID=UPI00372B89BF
MKLQRRQILELLSGSLLGGLFGLTIDPAAAEPGYSVDKRLAPMRWDEVAGLLIRHGGGPGYATLTTEAMQVHPTRDSMDYAVALADYGQPEARHRIARIIERMAQLQDVDQASPTYGTWPWFAEEPLSAMRPPDLNWANFIGARYCEMLWNHSDLLDAEATERARSALNHACGCIMRRNVGLDATNVVSMAIRVTAMSGRLLGRPDLSAYGANLLDRFFRYTRDQGGFVEYNSPTYTLTALSEFESSIHYLGDQAPFQSLRSLWRSAWEVVAFHFHPATVQWAGPHSRYYADLLTPLLWSQVAVRLGREVVDRNLPLQPPSWNMHPCPEDLQVYFTDRNPLPRNVRERVRSFPESGEELWSTTWLEQDVCLGSASIGNCWVQARPLIGYWKALPKPAVFRARVMKDGYDFASFGIRAQQKERSVLIACYPVINSGDRHVSADRSRSGYPGKSLVFRVSVEGAGAHAEQLDAGVFVLACQNWKAVVRGGPCMFDGVDMSSRWTVRTEAGLAAAELAIPLNGHISPERLGSTLLTASVTLGPVDENIAVADIEAAQASERDLVSTGMGASVKTLRWGDLRLSTPAGPAWR